VARLCPSPRGSTCRNNNLTRTRDGESCAKRPRRPALAEHGFRRALVDQAESEKVHLRSEMTRLIEGERPAMNGPTNSQHLLSVGSVVAFYDLGRCCGCTNPLLVATIRARSRRTKEFPFISNGSPLAGSAFPRPVGGLPSCDLDATCDVVYIALLKIEVKPVAGINS